MKIIHYINQFFGQIGGEEKADYPFEIRGNSRWTRYDVERAFRRYQ